MSTLTVCLHAWAMTESGDQTYADAANGEPVDGWTVYLRKDHHRDGDPFEIDIDEDFDTEEAARAFAEQLAAERCCQINEY